jgi:hypothetical protein
MNDKAYLGDGCYVSFDGYAFTLTTNNGISTTNEIVLEPEVYSELVRFVERLLRGDTQNIIKQDDTGDR